MKSAQELTSSQILISSTLIESSKLHAVIQSNFLESRIVSVARKHFDDARGLTLLKQLVVGDPHVIDLEAQSRFVIVKQYTFTVSSYLCIAAAHALLRYVELIQCVTFVASTLKVERTIYVVNHDANRLHSKV